MYNPERSCGKCPMLLFCQSVIVLIIRCGGSEKTNRFLNKGVKSQNCGIKVSVNSSTIITSTEYYYYYYSSTELRVTYNGT